MKKILVLGAAGQIARQFSQRLLAETDMELVLYGRNISTRLAALKEDRVSLVDGTFQDQKALMQALQGVDLVYLNAMSDAQATQTIISAMKQVGVTHLIGATIAGTEGEVPQPLVGWTEANLPAVYIAGEQASADAVKASGLKYILLRLTWLYDDPQDREYELVPSGTAFADAEVTREAVVQALLDLLNDENLTWDVTYGVGKPDTHYGKPSFY